MSAATQRPRTAAEKAVRHLLARAAQDTHGLGRYIGHGSESYELLCAAEAEYSGKTPDEIATQYGARPLRSTDAAPVTRVTFDVELSEEATDEALEHVCDVVEDEDLSTEGDPTDADRAAMTFCRALARATVEAQ